MKNFLENLKLEENLKLFIKFKHHFNELNNGNFKFNKYGKDYCFKKEIVVSEDDIVNALGFKLFLEEQNNLEKNSNELSLDYCKNKIKYFLSNFKEYAKIDKNDQSNFLISFFFFLNFKDINENVKIIKNLNESELNDFIKNYLKEEIVKRMAFLHTTYEDDGSCDKNKNENIQFSLNLINGSGKGKSTIKIKDLDFSKIMSFTFEDEIIKT